MQTQRAYLTEDYIVVLNNQGVPKDPAQIGRVRALFVDLSVTHVRTRAHAMCSVLRRATDCWPLGSYPRVRGPHGTDVRLRSQLSEHVFLVCRIVRVGKMNLTDKEKTSVNFRRPFGAAVFEVRTAHVLWGCACAQNDRRVTM